MLAIIPARKGSKRVIGKNTKILNGKPLISWTIEAALECTNVDDICISTDDTQVVSIANNYNIKTNNLRPSGLSGDYVHRNEVIAYELKNFPITNDFIYLQPTSPLRTANHISSAIDIYNKSDSLSLVSLCKQEPNPHFTFKITDDGFLEPIVKFDLSRSQDLPTYYTLNGAIYISNVEHFHSSVFEDPLVCNVTIPYIMDAKYSIDIDALHDFALAESLMKSL